MNRVAVVLTTVGLVLVGIVPPATAQTGPARSVISGSGSADGKPVRNTTARLRKIDTGEIAATAAIDNSGIFAFVNVPAGTYVVELVCNGAVLMGIGAPVAVAPNGTISRGVNVDVNAAAANAAGAATCVAPLSKANALLKAVGQPFTSALGVVVVGAAAASGVAGIVSIKNDTSASR
jgi:hypothetical protein